MRSLLKDNLPKIHELLRSYKVKRAFVFGSVCTDQFNEKSDIDILLSFDDDHIAIENYADNYFDLT
ncbi:MAG: nucleotidyltransferase domain-containing protein [Bacteroidota bacterium]